MRGSHLGPYSDSMRALCNQVSQVSFAERSLEGHRVTRDPMRVLGENPSPKSDWSIGELAVPAKGTEQSSVAGSAARVSSRAPTIRLSATVHFPATGEHRVRNASADTTRECIGCTGRKGWQCKVGGASDLEPKRGCHRRFRPVRTKCGGWTICMTS